MKGHTRQLPMETVSGGGQPWVGWGEGGKVAGFNKMSKPPRTSHVDFFYGNLLSSVVCKLNSRLDSVEVRDLGRGEEDIFVSFFP